jgi:ribosomal protein L21E
MLIIYMENMKSLADQLRQELSKPAEKAVKKQRKAEKKFEAAILDAILAYDTSINKSMVHVRFDEKTVRTMNQFKMATSVDVSKFVAFSVKHLLDTQPEIKALIKHFIQNNDL